MGSRASVALLAALDRSIQEGWLEPGVIAPVARLFGASDLVVRSDLEYERYRTVRPERMWQWVTRAPGLGDPATFGDDVPNVADASRPMIDEIELALGADAPQQPAVAVFPVEGELGRASCRVREWQYGWVWGGAG